MKKLIRFFKENPIFSVSITVGVLVLIYKKWDSIKRTTTKILTPMLAEFENPVTAKTFVSSKFGSRTDPKTGKVGTFHNGIDLAVPINTPVFAPADGVAHLSVTKDGGNQLVIVHNNGYKTGYAHLNSRTVSHLSAVKKGQLVAYTGNTGAHTTGAHLHLTLTDKTGKKCDPLTVFNYPLKA
jgi:murein DD-endopeptidase MepM/ murein hydrolase activator NlpD